MTGEPIFMIIMTLMLIAIVVYSIRFIITKPAKSFSYNDEIQKQLNLIKYVGMFALIVGIGGQIMGLYGAFIAIKKWGGVSSGVLFQGFTVSSVTTVYGLMILGVSLLVYTRFKTLYSKKLSR
ncbi:MAG: MotA/TolQ/ExbB proton channel family protein [Bacteroidota bacterium]